MIKFMSSLVLFFSTSLSWAFTLNSPSNPNFRGWPSSNVDFVINPTNCPASVQGLIESALDVWRNVSTSNIQVTVTGTTTSTSYSNPTTIYCETNFGTLLSLDENSIPGVASINPTGDYATGGLLILNVSSGTANISTFNPEILKIVIAHEIGHILGLGHSHDSSALMYYDASSKETLNLAQDDVDGISYLYPRDEVSGDDLFGGCGLIRNQRSPPGASLWMLLLPFFLALYLRWKNQRYLQSV